MSSSFEVDPRTILSAVHQFLSERGLTRTIAALAEESGVPHVQLPPGTSPDSLASLVRGGDWPAVLRVLRDVTLPEPLCARLHAHIALELSDAGDTDAVNALFAASVPLENARTGKISGGSSTSSSVDRQDPLSSPPCSSSSSKHFPTAAAAVEWYKRLGEALGGSGARRARGYEGGSRDTGRTVLAKEISCAVVSARPSRLVAALGDAARWRAKVDGTEISAAAASLFAGLAPLPAGAAEQASSMSSSSSSSSSSTLSSSTRGAAAAAVEVLPAPPRALVTSRRFPRRARPTALCASGDGHWLAVGGPDGLVELVDPREDGVPTCTDDARAPFQAREDFISVGPEAPSAITALATVQWTGAAPQGSSPRRAKLPPPLLLLLSGTARGRVAAHSIPAGEAVLDVPNACPSLAAVSALCGVPGDGGGEGDDDRHGVIFAGDTLGNVTVVGLVTRTAVARFPPPAGATGTAAPAVLAIDATRGAASHCARVAALRSDGSVTVYSSDSQGGSARRGPGAPAWTASHVLPPPRASPLSSSSDPSAAAAAAAANPARLPPSGGVAAACALRGHPGSFLAIFANGALCILHSSPDRDRANSADHTGPARSWDPVRTLAFPGAGSAVASSCDGSRAIVGSAEGAVCAVRLWGVAAGESDAAWECGSKGGLCDVVADSVDPGVAMTLGADSILSVWGPNKRKGTTAPGPSHRSAVPPVSS